MVSIRAIVLCAAFASAAFSTTVSYKFDDEFRSDEHVKEESKARAIFQEWAQHHEKEYSGLEEEERRFLTFWDNAKQIHQHNNFANAAFVLGVNHLSDMTPREASQQVGGHIPSSTQVSAAKIATAPVTAGHLPGEDVTSSCGFTAQKVDVSQGRDWRDVEGVLAPIKNQQKCGSCWAYATVAAVESAVAIMENKPVVPLSEQELTDCCLLGSFCDGGNIEEGFKWVVANGIGSIENYPYNNEYHTNTTCKLDQAFKRAGTIDNYEMVPRGEYALRQAVHVSPVAIGINAFGPKLMHYKSGIFHTDEPRGIENLDHAVSVVGYGSTPVEQEVDRKTVTVDTPYFVVRNSWGHNWGEEGYVRIKAGEYPETGTLGIAMLVVRPVKDGSWQYHVNFSWPQWAKDRDPNKHDLAPPSERIIHKSPPSIKQVQVE